MTPGHVEGSPEAPEGLLLITVGGEINTNMTAQVFRQDDEGSNHVQAYLTQFLHPDLVSTGLLVENDGEILSSIQGASEQRVLVACPRDRVQDLGQFLQSQQSSFQGKSVVLVSSKRDLDGVTDARFNLGFSVGVLQYLPEGEIVTVDRGKIRYTDGELCPYNLEDFAVLCSGGTVAGRPNFVQDGVIEMMEEDPVEPFIRFLDLELEYRVISVAMKDSRDMGHRERAKLFRTIRETVVEGVALMTHGTYTLAKMVRDLNRRMNALLIQRELPAREGGDESLSGIFCCRMAA